MPQGLCRNLDFAVRCADQVFRVHVWDVACVRACLDIWVQASVQLVQVPVPFLVTLLFLCPKTSHVLLLELVGEF